MNQMFFLLRLRVLIGYLGEKSQFSWWQTDFFSPAATAFMEPLFPRTKFLAQCEGVCAAACKLHDERIGVGRVFHLFRLPEEVEQAFHQTLQEREVIDSLIGALKGKDSVLELMASDFGQPSKASSGPVLVGGQSALLESQTLQSIAHGYLSGFSGGTEVFPYLKDDV